MEWPISIVSARYCRNTVPHFIGKVLSHSTTGYVVCLFDFCDSVDATTGKLMMLPTDLVLLQDPKFSKWVAVYAKDGQKFNQDFSKAFQKLEELGTSNLKPTEWA